METFTEILLKFFVEPIVISGVIGYFLIKREERLKHTIEAEFKKRDMFFNAQFNFKQRALEELLAPIKLQLIRSSLALKSYKQYDPFREKILKECNETILNLLLNKGFLIPVDLFPYAEKFISHYDEWLHAYYESREVKNDKKTPYVFTYNFPADAEKAFNKKYNDFRQELEMEKTLNKSFDFKEK